MIVKINKSNAKGIVNANPSKSYTHRFLINACLSKKITVIKNVCMSSDVIATIDALKAFNKKVEITGVDIKDLVIKEKETTEDSDNIIINCNESGSTLRFFVPIALSLYNRSTFVCSKRLIERGIDEYFKICDEQNINYEIVDNKIRFKGKLQPGKFILDGSKSSQYLTGLLYALPLLDGTSEIEVNNLVSKNYIDLTLYALKKAGIKIKRKDNKFIIKGKQKYKGKNYTIEGDYSNACVFECFNYLDGEVLINGLNSKSLQGDKVFYELIEKLDKNNETIDLKNAIDLAPVLMCFSALKHGGTFINTNNLKIKESDRIAAVKEELEKINVKVIEEDNKVVIDNSNILYKNVKFDSHNDHRIIMGLSLILTKLGGTIKNVSSINKSYPNFFKDLKKLNIDLDIIYEE